jgi:hypothetical protein
MRQPDAQLLRRRSVAIRGDRVRCARGGGTSAVSLAMTNRQVCLSGRPQIAQREGHSYVPSFDHCPIFAPLTTSPPSRMSSRTNSSPCFTKVSVHGRILRKNSVGDSANISDR